MFLSEFYFLSTADLVIFISNVDVSLLYLRFVIKIELNQFQAINNFDNNYNNMDVNSMGTPCEHLFT